MSFYHVLPSNAAPNTFPNNHASSFSTPLENPYNLTGQWEVAMMNISYTGCVNTFNRDMINLSYTTDLNTRILKTQSPVSWKVPQQKTLVDMLNEIKKSLKGIVDVTVNGKHCKWTVKSKDMFVIMSRNLADAIQLEQDVLTPWDNNVSNWLPFKPADAMPKNISLTFVPLNYKHSTIEVKAANETLSMQQLLSRFNERIPGASMSQKETSLQVEVKANVLLFSSELTRFVNYQQSGIHLKPPSHTYTSNKFISMNEPWIVSVYEVNQVEDHTSPLKQTIILPCASFQRHHDAVTSLNTLVPHVKFSVDKKNFLQLTIQKENLSLTLSDTLRDIFAFDKNTYTGAGTFRASGTFSLTRRIHYLYVYSSISDYVRIGNTEAPLLAVIPFSVSSSCDILKEEVFKNPMYVPMRHSTVSQIDIEIYDDAGELVPFVAEAVTSLRLHYRQV